MFRRKALREVGYIATETITEDMHTGLRMERKGYKSLGVSERLIYGQAGAWHHAGHLLAEVLPVCRDEQMWWQSNSLWPFIRPHVYFIGISLLALVWDWSPIVNGISDDYFKPVMASCWAIFHMSLAIARIRRSLWPEDQRYSYRQSVHLPVGYLPEGLSGSEQLVPRWRNRPIDQELPSPDSVSP
jgi:hypothetical protein